MLVAYPKGDLCGEHRNRLGSTLKVAYTGQIITATRVLTWSTASLGALLGGLAIEQTNHVALVYVVIGLLIFGITFTFFLTPLGHTERYLPQNGPPQRQAGEPASP
jgi:hypothetical protein